MLHILFHHAKPQHTLDKVMEFGGPGLGSLSPDERATLANMATECSAKSGIVEADDATLVWLAARRNVSVDELRSKVVAPDPDAKYSARYEIDLAQIHPMVATPGDPEHGVPSDPTNGAGVGEIGRVRIDIAYGGSCTAGKEDDIDMYARVMQEALAAGKRVAAGVDFYIQFGSRAVEDYARKKGYLDVFAQTGVKVISPGCGACIGCGPGVSSTTQQVTVSAINRNYQNRSGPGRLYLASPLSVAASAVEGTIVAYEEGMFRRKP
jgi:3-isopropylmalate/(R)-2-methylmalate dehydratase large subunit